ncbi:MAG: hypothetical protein ACT4PP_17155 [Sporichthyaceae bacterium]
MTGQIAADFATWCATDLAAFYAEEEAAAAAQDHEDEHDHDHVDPATLALLTREGLLAGDLAHLRATFAEVCADGSTPQAAATYLAGWFAGGVAQVVSLALVTARAGVLLEPAVVGWRVASEGWPEIVECGAARVLVEAGHPWASHPGVSVVAGAAQVREQAVGALVEFARPILDACRKLAKVSRSGLWDEVADYLGSVLVDRLDIEVSAQMLADLGAVLAVPGAPWKSRPRLGWAEATFGRVHVLHKVGCCLSFTERTPPEEDAEILADDPAFYARFPLETLGKRYCANCKFRDEADAHARQVFTLESRHARDHGGAGVV